MQLRFRARRMAGSKQLRRTLPVSIYNSNKSSLPSHMPYDNFAPRIGLAANLQQSLGDSRWRRF